MGRSKLTEERSGGVYIADAARITGVSAGTLRAWEDQGLVQPERIASGYRVYRDEDLTRLSEIKKLRSASLPASEISRRLPPIPDRSPNGDGVGPADSEADGSRSVGRRIKLARELRGMSIRRLASASGLAASHISAIERGIGRPSIAALQKLAESLGSNVPTLVGFEPTGEELVRADRRRTLKMGINGVRFEHLAEVETSFEPLLMTVEPGKGSYEDYSHKGEEFIYVIEGRLRVVLDGTREFDLAPADSLTFASHRPHRWWAIGETPAVLVWVNSPPTF